MTKDLTRYATADATPTMEAFADFLIAEVYGGTLPEGFDVESFRKGVALGGSTRNYFQASEAWKNDSRNYLANVETNRAAKAAESAERAKVASAKAAAREAKAIAVLEAAVAAAKAKARALDGPDYEVSESAEELSPAATEGLADGEEALAAKAEAEADAPRRSRNRAA